MFTNHYKFLVKPVISDVAYLLQKYNIIHYNAYLCIVKIQIVLCFTRGIFLSDIFFVHTNMPIRLINIESST